MITFLITVAKYLTRSNLREEGFVLVWSLRREGMAWRLGDIAFSESREELEQGQ